MDDGRSDGETNISPDPYVGVMDSEHALRVEVIAHALEMVTSPRQARQIAEAMMREHSSIGAMLEASEARLQAYRAGCDDNAVDDLKGAGFEALRWWREQSEAGKPVADTEA